MTNPEQGARFEQDEHLVLTGWDSEAARLFGWAADDIVGRPSHLLVPERNRQRHTRSLEALLADPSRRPVTYYVTGLHVSGREFKLEVRVSVTTVAASTRIQVQAWSAREVVDARLQDAELRFLGLIDRLEDGYFEINLSQKARYELVNDAFCRITGYSREELVGRSYDFFRRRDRADAV